MPAAGWSIVAQRLAGDTGSQGKEPEHTGACVRDQSRAGETRERRLGIVGGTAGAGRQDGVTGGAATSRRNADESRETEEDDRGWGSAVG